MTYGRWREQMYDYKEELRKIEEEITNQLELFLKAEEYYKNGEFKESAELYRQSAFPVTGEDCYNWGVVLNKGINGIQYPELAIKYFKQAADKYDYMSAQRVLTDFYYFGKVSGTPDYEQAYYYAKQAAKNSDGYGKYMVGLLYYNGEYVEKDYNEARKNFENVGCCCVKTDNIMMYTYYILGVMSYKGQGGKTNFSVAKEYFEEYLEEKDREYDAEVYYYLGMIYLKAENYLRDIDRSYLYFKMSEEIKEDDENEFWIGILSCALGDENVVNKESDTWLRKAEAHGNKMAKKCLADDNIKAKYVKEAKGNKDVFDKNSNR